MAHLSPSAKRLARQVWNAEFEIGVFGRRPFLEALLKEVCEILARSRALWPATGSAAATAKAQQAGQVPHEQRASEPTLESWGVSFRGSLVDCYALNLCSALASRVVLRLPELRAGAREELFLNVRKLPWDLWLPGWVAGEGALDIRVHMDRSRIHHFGLAESALRDGIGAALAASGSAGQSAPANAAAPAGQPAGRVQRMYLHAAGTKAVLSLDTSGQRLYHRSWRLHSGRAPLSEQLAAGLVRSAAELLPEPAWVLDPMCGSGTFRFEAALFLAGAAVGAARSFSFQDWPNFRSKHFAHLGRNLGFKPGLEPSRVQAALPVFSSDIDADALAAASANSQRFSQLSGIPLPELLQKDFFDIEAPKAGSGWVFLNPPYNIRLEGGGKGFLKKVAAWAGRLPAGSVFVLLSPETEAEEAGRALWAVAQSLSVLKLDHGGLSVRGILARI